SGPSDREAGPGLRHEALSGGGEVGRLRQHRSLPGGLGRRAAQTMTSVPVTSAAAGEARNRIACATDSGFTHFDTSAPGMARRFASVSMVLGRTAFTVTRWGRASCASAAVSARTADFDTV